MRLYSLIHVPGWGVSRECQGCQLEGRSVTLQVTTDLFFCKGFNYLSIDKIMESINPQVQCIYLWKQMHFYYGGVDNTPSFPPAISLNSPSPPFSVQSPQPQCTIFFPIAVKPPCQKSVQFDLLLTWPSADFHLWRVWEPGDVNFGLVLNMFDCEEIL